MLEVDLPGVSRENVQLDIHGDRLVIYGKRFREMGWPNGGPDEVSPSSEINQRPNLGVEYILELPLGHETDHTRTTAQHHGDGTLSVRIPLTEDVRRRTVLLAS